MNKIYEEKQTCGVTALIQIVRNNYIKGNRNCTHTHSFENNNDMIIYRHHIK